MIGAVEVPDYVLQIVDVFRCGVQRQLNVIDKPLREFGSVLVSRVL